MPELPEVQTTVNGIRKHAAGLVIEDVWTDYSSPLHANKPNIKNRAYFKLFRNAVIGGRIEDSSRVGKNVLIHLSNGKTVVIHMKMTGHLLYGRYKYVRGEWKSEEAGPLRDDSFNRFIRLVFTLSDGRHLALSDLRRFAKVCVIDTKDMFSDNDLHTIGPDPFSRGFSREKLAERLQSRPNGRIKQVLMDPKVIAGIGNIYSDELLWRAGVHPLSIVSRIPQREIARMFDAMLAVLQKGIDFGGDSMSDYRNLLGESGKFQGKHEAYRRTGEKCRKPGCGGTIKRIKLGGRSAHFCKKHQRLYS